MNLGKVDQMVKSVLGFPALERMESSLGNQANSILEFSSCHVMLVTGTSPGSCNTLIKLCVCALLLANLLNLDLANINLVLSMLTTLRVAETQVGPRNFFWVPHPLHRDFYCDSGDFEGVRVGPLSHLPGPMLH